MTLRRGKRRGYLGVTATEVCRFSSNREGGRGGVYQPLSGDLWPGSHVPSPSRGLFTRALG